MNINKYKILISGAIIGVLIGWLSYTFFFSHTGQQVPFLSPISQSKTEKSVLGSFDRDYKVTLISAPKQVEADTIVTFTWTVEGSETIIHHTSVQMGKVSNPGRLGNEIKASDTKYTDKVTDFNYGNYNIPLQFIGNIKMLEAGRYYYRVYAEISGKNYWSSEYNFDVLQPTIQKTNDDYKITIVYPSKLTNFSILPKNEKENIGRGVMTFTWWIEGPANSTNFTTIYYGRSSNAGIISDVNPSDTTYSDYVRDFTNGKYNIPLQFVGNTSISSPGTYYYRGYAFINGKNYWTDEYTMNIQ